MIPAQFYLTGIPARWSRSPQYDDGEGMNVTVMLMPPGVEIDQPMIPMMHWQAGLFGRGTQNLVLRNRACARHWPRWTASCKSSGKIQQLAAARDVAGDSRISNWPRITRPAPGRRRLLRFLSRSYDGGWGLFIADVSGHGTPAAVLMAITHAIAHAQPGTHTPPACLLSLSQRSPHPLLHARRDIRHRVLCRA